jgi:hypothetical protein
VVLTLMQQQQLPHWQQAHEPGHHHAKPDSVPAVVICIAAATAGIGRFLRLTVSNIRLRIAYEDFPSTQRLVAMVQVGARLLETPVQGWAELAMEVGVVGSKRAMMPCD